MNESVGEESGKTDGLHQVLPSEFPRGKPGRVGSAQDDKREMRWERRTRVSAGLEDQTRGSSVGVETDRPRLNRLPDECPFLLARDELGATAGDELLIEAADGTDETTGRFGDGVEEGSAGVEVVEDWSVVEERGLGTGRVISV
jgi:hypothetical protein